MAVCMRSHSECFSSLHVSFSMVARIGSVGESSGIVGCHHHPSSSLFLPQLDSLSSSSSALDLESHHHHHPLHRHHYYQGSETIVGGLPCHHPSARTAFNVLSQPYWWFPSDTSRGPVALHLLRLSRKDRVLCQQ
ncbi:hypothetical protein QBC45DRAFT_326021 [Copromyces sp. CBS 386.78]|nr:hypothetical protein QBC45DRAFT_326021 [Copromyces sp. CBS 386.78]